METLIFDTKEAHLGYSPKYLNSDCSIAYFIIPEDKHHKFDKLLVMFSFIENIHDSERYLMKCTRVNKNKILIRLFLCHESEVITINYTSSTLQDYIPNFSKLISCKYGYSNPPTKLSFKKNKLVELSNFEIISDLDGYILVDGKIEGDIFKCENKDKTLIITFSPDIEIDDLSHINCDNYIPSHTNINYTLFHLNKETYDDESYTILYKKFENKYYTKIFDKIPKSTELNIETIKDDIFNKTTIGYKNISKKYYDETLKCDIYESHDINSKISTLSKKISDILYLVETKQGNKTSVENNLHKTKSFFNKDLLTEKICYNKNNYTHKYYIKNENKSILNKSVNKHYEVSDTGKLKVIITTTLSGSTDIVDVKSFSIEKDFF